MSKTKKNRTKILNLVIFSVLSSVITLLSVIPQIGYITIGIITITIVHIPVLIGIMLLPIYYAASLGAVFGISSLIQSYIYGASPLDLAFQNPIISVIPRIVFAIIAFFVLKLFVLIENKVKFSNFILFFIVSVATFMLISYSPDAIAQGFYSSDINSYNRLITILKPIFIIIGVMFITFYYFISDKYKSSNSNSVSTTLIISTLIHTVLVLGMLYIYKVDGIPDQFIKILGPVIATNGILETILACLIGTPIILALKTAFPDLSNNLIVLKKKEKKENNKNDTNI